MHIVLTAQDLERIKELVKQARTQFSLATVANANTRAYIVYAPYDATFVTIVSEDRPEGLIFFYVDTAGKVVVAGFGAYMQVPKSHEDVYAWMAKTFQDKPALNAETAEKFVAKLDERFSQTVPGEATMMGYGG